MKKRIFAIVLSLCMIAAMIPCMSFASSTVNVNSQDELVNYINSNPDAGTCLQINSDFAITKNINIQGNYISVPSDKTLTISSGYTLTGCMEIYGKVIVKKNAYLKTGTTAYTMIRVNNGATLDLQGGYLVTTPRTDTITAKGILNNSGSIINSTKTTGYIYLGADDYGNLRFNPNSGSSIAKSYITVKYFKDDKYLNVKNSENLAYQVSALQTLTGKKFSYAGALNLAYLTEYDFSNPNYMNGQWYFSCSSKPTIKMTGIPTSAYTTSYKTLEKSSAKLGLRSFTLTAKGKLYTGKTTVKGGTLLGENSGLVGLYVAVPKTPSISKITVGKKKMTVKMSTKPSATGGTKYVVYYKVAGTNKISKKTTTSQTVTIKSLKKGKKYKVYVCAAGAVPAQMKTFATQIGMGDALSGGLYSSTSKTKTSGKIK